MSDSSDGFNEHRRTLLNGIETLNKNVASIAEAQQRTSIAAEGVNAQTKTRLDEISAWKADIEKRLREDIEKRLRDLEATRSQAIAFAALLSVVLGVLIATLARVLVR